MWQWQTSPQVIVLMHRITADFDKKEAMHGSAKGEDLFEKIILSKISFK